ncbi:MAG: BolA/IbaG family iron-sulfur metabolism protein [Porticoccus sp.]|nr:BolA/IbaG family iron-sulfur metabolism protein [Porticoccus sp.]
MNPEDVKALLLAELVGCDVTVEGDGRHFDVQVVGDLFEGLRPVQRQQKVYAVLQAQIADGAIHAVNMKTFTPGELQQ